MRVLSNTFSVPVPHRGSSWAQRDSSVETFRIAATIMLVAFHAVGGVHTGLELGATHPLRLANSFLADIRMPLFAFIAGYVYAMRPVEAGRLGSFAVGKVRRLLVPGAVAALAFALAATVTGRRFAVPVSEFWQVLIHPYAHFWFLQAIFVTLMCIAAAEAAFGRRAAVALFAASSVALVAGRGLHVPFFSIGAAAYLMPYFTLGILGYRHRDVLERHRTLAIFGALTLAALACAWNFHLYAEEGAFSGNRRDLQSWAFGTGFCLLAVLLPIRFAPAASLGACTFTIYLYHVFGTSGARQVLQLLQVGNVWLLFAGSLAAGLALPVALHLVAARFRLGRQLVLGLR